MLHLHRAERADGLIEGLSGLLSEAPADPFAAEVVAVPTRGMERWLAQQLSAHLGATDGRSDGVCANVEFPSPRWLVTGAVARASGVDPDEDPWRPERAAWPLLEVVEECLGEPWLAPLAHHLRGSATRRLTTVRHFAELFDRYGLHRPELVCAWAAGGGADHWQAELWRRLRARIGVASPAERLDPACERLRAQPGIADLPDRVSVFGLTRIPESRRRVLEALAAARDVHLFLLHPSPALWERVAALAPAPGPRAADASAQLPRHPLLASWGADAREMQVVLAAAEHADHHHAVQPDADAPPSLLARVQADVRADREPGAGPPPAADDDSVRVHACHGRARQVEVVRDAILHALQRDETLEPRDVIVMCPDIETFAPLIEATFGAGEVGEDADAQTLPADVRPPDLRVRLADRALRQTNAVLGVVASLLDLAGSRVTASEVLALADREPVRRRFRLDDEDLTRLQDWIADSGIRWGLDAAHRAPFRLAGQPAGTWRAGLDRVLVGVTMTESDQRLFERVLPLDDVESAAIDRAGRFAELIDRLGAALDSLRGPQPIGAWAAALADAADALVATSPRDGWQREELGRVLADAVGESGSSATGLTLSEVRALLAERLAGRPTRANFRTGHLTVCTLHPMRSVPHRVVCLLGLDDGVFPRRAARDGDDLTLAQPQLGDRDPRTEDRQLLLDALLAAQDRLIVTYTGNDERTNAPQPPAVPVGELLDVIAATAGPAAREGVLIRHPLQPFDPRNFTPGELTAERPWSFDSVTLDGARALAAPRSDPPSFLPAPLPPAAPALLEVEDLVRFVEHPVRAFLRQRLQTGVGSFTDEPEDGLRVELDGLQKWSVGQRLLDARLAGVDGRATILAEIARGSLPPGRLGEPVVNEIYPVADQIVAAAREAAPGDGAADSVDVRVALGDGRSVGGTVAGVRGDVLRMVTYSRVAAKHRLAAWVRLLALTAAHPERPFCAATVGRGRSGVAVARIAPLGPDSASRRAAALEHLAVLADLHAAGLREPLPLYCNTSAAWAAASRAGDDPRAGAAKAWESGYRFDGEDAQPEHELVLGGRLSFDALLDREPARLGALAERLWEGLLSCEELTGT